MYMYILVHKTQWLTLYGKNCTMVCGQCTEISDCSNDNGICESGCNPGYIGLHCKEGLRYFACIYCNVSKALTTLSVYSEIMFG